MTIEHDFSGCLEQQVGPVGLSDAVFQNWLEQAGQQARHLQRLYEENGLALLRISEAKQDIEIASEAFARLTEGARSVVFFGTGGSSLGGQAIAQIGGWSIPGIDGKGPNKLPRTRIFDNLDPTSLKHSIQQLDLEETRFVVTSKSGNTAETLLQLIVAIDAFREAGLESLIGKGILGISEPRQPGVANGLRDLLEGYGCEILDHERDIGGRFSCLTNVGLMLALARGLDPYAIRQGASDVMTELLSSSSFEASLPVVGSALNVGLFREKGVSTVVMMPYANQLDRFSHWFVQLWAESLGKDGLGTTPVAALGPVDQHSQLQLYMDGPKDKLVTVIAPRSEGKGPRIEKGLAVKAGLDYMADRTIGDLVNAQARATVDALRGAGQPTRFISIPTVEEHVLGYLMMNFMIETILSAGLLGVDAFDQPAVEVGKGIARDFLTR